VSRAPTKKRKDAKLADAWTVGGVYGQHEEHRNATELDFGDRREETVLGKKKPLLLLSAKAKEAKVSE